MSNVIAIKFDGIIYPMSQVCGSDIYRSPSRDCVNALWRLKDAGFSIVVVTDRPIDSVKTWISKVGLSNVISDVTGEYIRDWHYVDASAYRFSSWNKLVSDISICGKLVVWFTGLPCSGKTTIADGVAELLDIDEYSVERLDGDVVRETLCADLGFSNEDRMRNIARVSFVARMLARNKTVVLCSFVSPNEECRQIARDEVEKDATFFEVYVRCPVGICAKRDVKGMYARASAGEIKGFTGVDAPFEEPKHADLIVDTDVQSVEESVHIVADEIRRLVC